MKKNLIIEDEVLLGENISTHLSEAGYKTFFSDNREKGLQKALEIIPDLIVCDIYT